MTEPSFFNRGRRAHRARDRRPDRRQAAAAAPISIAASPALRRSIALRPTISTFLDKPKYAGAARRDAGRRLPDDGALARPRPPACQRALRARALSRLRRGGAGAVSGRAAAVLAVRGAAAWRAAPSSIRPRGMESGVTVDPGAVIGPRAEIGAGTVIGAGAVIGPKVRIGRDCAIGANVIDHA